MKVIADSIHQQAAPAGDFEHSGAASPELHPVVEAPWFEGVPPWPWPIADCKPFSFIRLSGDMTDLEVGSVMAQFVGCNDAESEPTVAGLLTAEIEREAVSLSSGIQVSGSGREINPSCCSGLEEWREWFECLTSGRSPWMGHDPTPWIERAGNIVRVWSDGGYNLTPKADAFAIEFERDRFVAELKRVEQELRAFLLRVGAWAEAVGFQDGPALCRLLDVHMRITEPAASE